MPPELFAAKVAHYKSKEFRIKWKQSYELNGKVLLVAIWEKIPQKAIWFWDAGAKVPTSGRRVGQLKPFDELMNNSWSSSNCQARHSLSRETEKRFFRGGTDTAISKTKK